MLLGSHGCPNHLIFLPAMTRKQHPPWSSNWLKWPEILQRHTKRAGSAHPETSATAVHACTRSFTDTYVVISNEYVEFFQRSNGGSSFAPCYLICQAAR